MSLHDPILVFFLLSELILGVLGNSFLFSLSVHSCLRRPPLRKPIHLLLAHLSLTNALSTVFRLTPDVMSFFGGTQLFLLSDPSCRALLYAYSVTRALIISTLSLLTAFQAVTLYPGHLDWAWLNWKAPSFVFPTCLCLWIFNLLLYLPVLNHVHMQGNSSSPASAFPQAPCESSQLRYHTTMVLLCVMTTRDVFCVVLMSAASLYMVTFLYTHRQIALHLHSPRLASQLPPEIRATYSILTLVAFFGCGFGLNNFVTFYLFYRPQKNPALDKLSRILSSCYPSICPFVLMSNRKVIFKSISSFSTLRIFFAQRRFHR